MKVAEPVPLTYTRKAGVAHAVVGVLRAKKEKRRKEKLSIYLAKDARNLDDDILKTEDALDPIDIRVINGNAKLYVKKEIPRSPPAWSHLFTSHQQLPNDLFGHSNTVGAVLILRDHDRLFALAFGSGYHLLKSDMIERDFGLRVTLNSVDPNKLRSLDKASYEDNPLNSRTQSTREVDIFQLHIDSELELMYAVTGVSNVPSFGSHVTGRDALTIATEVTIDGISVILAEALSRYARKLPVEFEWVDNINRVKDKEEIEILDLELDKVLLGGEHKNLYLGEPEIVDWEAQIGYSFDLRPNTDRHVVLELGDFIEYLTSHQEILSCESLKMHKIHVNNSEYQALKSWSAYRCLYAEVEYGDRQYVLRNGSWYRIVVEYVAVVDAYLKGMEVYPHELPAYNHDREDEYNRYVVASDVSFGLMDKANVQIGGPLDKLEFCDLTKDEKDFIHVKYYRSSATLSHLFSQGVVAAHAFVGELEFRIKLNGKLPQRVKLENPTLRPEPSAYKIVYAIATQKNIPEELPFFSKVTLKQALKSLRTLGYQVALAKIAVDDTLYAKKKIKPKPARRA